MAQAHKRRLKQLTTRDLIIYTNDSGHNGQISAAMYSPSLKIAKKEYISIEEIRNIYVAEIMVIEMTVSLYKTKIEEYLSVYIFTDDQSGIQTIEAWKCQSGQYIIKGILYIIDRIYIIKSTCKIHIEWISGHDNIDGNEWADQAAKAAAIPNNASINIRMRSVLKREIQIITKTKWETDWKIEKKISKWLRNICQQSDIIIRPKLYGDM
jgi:hypothetical protein